MRIESSVTGMESERSFSAVNYSARSFEVTEKYTEGGIGLAGGSARGSSFLDTLLGKYDEKKAPESSDDEKEVRSIEDIMDEMSSGSVKSASDITSSEAKSSSGSYVKEMSVLYLFSLLFEEFRERLEEYMSGLRKQYEGGNGDCLSDPGQVMRQKTVHVEYVQKEYSFESESTDFKTKGKAVCKDGREIEFDIHAHMSRSFESAMTKKLGVGFDACIDPLVINLNDNVTEISDQEFYFDLDADGKEDKIKMLGKGNGYLAYDKNGDGTINDGSELFGTKSGNGFADLAAYDSDRDGWIDEDDDIFDKLKVWMKDDTGSDRLLTLKEAGVGAINLMNADTEFSIKDMENRSKAYVRSTGMFLYEDGRAGTLQQVDMVS